MVQVGLGIFYRAQEQEAMPDFADALLRVHAGVKMEEKVEYRADVSTFCHVVVNSARFAPLKAIYLQLLTGSEAGRLRATSLFWFGEGGVLSRFLANIPPALKDLANDVKFTIYIEQGAEW